jgi:hypothetical protein
MDFIYDDGGRGAAGFRGTTGDCVCRAIAIATEKPYQEVYDQLNATKDGMRQTRGVRGSSSRTGMARRVYERYLASLGWRFVPTMAIGTGCKVHLNDAELPAGRIICRLSKHLCAVIDGAIHDTHNPNRGKWYEFSRDDGRELAANQGRNQNGIYTIHDGRRCVYGYFVEPDKEEKV